MKKEIRLQVRANVCKKKLSSILEKLNKLGVLENERAVITYDDSNKELEREILQILDEISTK